VIHPAVGAGAEDDYIHGIVELEEDVEAYLLMEMKLRTARQKA
jgi:hypothetical protein